MIINYPTGLYRSIIPENPGDHGNVTFTISMLPPPRTNLLFPKIADGLTGRQRQPVVKPLAQRRAAWGDLIFVVSVGTASSVNNNSAQYQLGQVLDFGSVVPQSVQPMLVAPVTETRHDVNMIDYAALGLSSDDQATIAAAALATQGQLTAQLNNIKQQRADAEITINIQQKAINDTNRAIMALQIAEFADPSVAVVIQKLIDKRTAAFTARDQAMALADTLAQQATVVVDQLRSVATILK